jgi:2-oxoglutarate-Fe(II)-dependent oxygenase superfamily protein
MNGAGGGSPVIPVGQRSTLSFACYGARILVFEEDGADVTARLRASLPHEVHVGVPGAPDVGYEVCVYDPGEVAWTRTYEVSRNGRPCFRAAPLERIVRRLRSDIDLQVAQYAREGLFVHAGVVGWRGQAIVIPGRTMTGKSHLVAALMRLGARYYSDEYAVIDDGGRVHPYTRPLSLRNGVGLEPTEPVDDLGGTDREPLPVALIVSTAYQTGVPWSPAMVTGARAVLPLIDNTVVAAAEPSRTIRLAARLGPGVVTLQGPRPEAESVAPRLLQAVDEILDDPAMRFGGRLGGMASPRWGGYDLPRSPRPGRDGDERPCPARFLRIENLLEPAEHQRLLEYVQAHETEFRPGRVFPVDGPDRVDIRVRQARDKVGLGEVWDLFETRVRRLLPEVRQALGVPWFPLGRIERHVAVHAAGDFFGKHTDNGREPVAGRRITGVYYFNWTPRRFSGGQLRLYDGVLRGGWFEAASTYTEVEPVDNSLVFFPSELFHEVRPVHGDTAGFCDSRFTVNIWYWTEPGPRFVPDGHARGR